MYDMLFYTITSFVTVFITNYIFYDYFRSRYEKKYNRIVYFLYLISFTFMVVYINSLGSVMSNYIVNLILFIGLGMLFLFKNIKEWILNITFFLIIVLIDMACFIIIDTSISFLGNASYQSFNRSILEMILESMILFVVYYLAKSYFYQREYIFLKTKDIFIYIAISLFSWILCYSLTVFSTYYQDRIFQIFTFIVTIIILVLNVVFISFEETISKKHELERNVQLINEKAESVLKYYKRIEEKEKKSAMLMHDIKNHLQTLQNMIDENENVVVHSYFNKIERDIDISDKSFFCENKVLEILINDKIEVAKKNNINVEVRYDNTDITFISEFDLVTILANMFDNAIDALTLEQFKCSEKKITLYIRRIHSYLIIKMINPCNNSLIKNEGIIKTTKKNHSGLGIMSIKSCIAKYKADCKIELKEKIFAITIAFPINFTF